MAGEAGGVQGMGSGGLSIQSLDWNENCMLKWCATYMAIAKNQRVIGVQQFILPC